MPYMLMYDSSKRLPIVIEQSEVICNEVREGWVPGGQPNREG